MSDAEKTPATDSGSAPESWAAVLSWSFKAFAVTVVAWTAIRAFTGIFEIRNLRILVAACVLTPVVLGQIYLLAKTSSRLMIPLISLFGMVSLVLAEGLAALVTGQFYPPWGDLDMGFLVVLGALPIFFCWKMRQK
jgi:hypothetical protein